MYINKRLSSNHRNSPVRHDICNSNNTVVLECVVVSIVLFDKKINVKQAKPNRNYLLFSVIMVCSKEIDLFNIVTSGKSPYCGI